MRKIIIVGASSGLGARVASDFARMGWLVGIAARRTQLLDELKAEFPDRMVSGRLDVTSPDAAKDFGKLIEECGGMDVLLFCTGVGYRDEELDDNTLDGTLQTNVVGFARILAEGYKYFRRINPTPRPGQIAAITSVAATKGIGVAAAYSASKRFQQTFIDALEQLSYRQGVHVDFTDIRPGFIDTALLSKDRTYPMLMSIDKVAPMIEEAILRRKRRTTIDCRWRVLTALWRLMPQCLWKRLDYDM